jgi:hypothetical protein
LLFDLLDEDLRDWIGDERERPHKPQSRVQLGQEPAPDITQSSLRAAAD